MVGPVLSLFLAKLGQHVEIFERRADPREASSVSGRSINITLCERGFHALDRIGLGEKLRRLGIPARGRVIHQRDGSIKMQPYGNAGEAIYSIARRDIHETVVECATTHPLISAHFERPCLGIDLDDPDGPTIRVKDPASGRQYSARGRTVFACDGAHSRLRVQLLHRGRFNYSQYYVPQGYKELRLPSAPDGSHRLEKEAIHIWPRGRHMLIGFANRDGSFTLALHLPFEGETSFSSITDGPSVEALFERDFRDLRSHMPDLVEDFLAHPITSMITVRCAPWSTADRLLLVGDACHAIVPSYGQGANCSFENCSVLYDFLKANGEDWATAFKRYEERQKPETDTIADIALEHFEELQRWVGDEEFLLRKDLENRIEARFPGRFRSLYSMISFTTMPYTEAQRHDRLQRCLVDDLLAHKRSQDLEPHQMDRLINECFKGSMV